MQTLVRAASKVPVDLSGSLPPSIKQDRWSRALLWLGLVNPFVAIGQSHPFAFAGLEGVDVLRFGVPTAALVLSVLMSRPKRRLSLMIQMLVLSFVGVALLSSLWSSSASASALRAGLLTSQYLALLALARRYETTEQAFDGITRVIHLLLWTVPLGVVLDPDAALHAFAGADSYRLAGVYPQIHPNILGAVAAAGIVLTVLPSRVPRLMGTGRRFVLLACYVVILVGARARFALFFTLVVLVLVGLRTALKRPLILSSVLLLLAVGGVVGSMQADQTLDFLRRDQNDRNLLTFSGRTEIWSIALDATDEDRLLGRGYYAGHRTGLGLPPEQSNLDNTWIETLVDVGLVGTASLAIFTMAGMWRARQSLNSKVALEALFVLFVCISVINPSLQTLNLVGILFAFLLVSGEGPRNQIPRRLSGGRATS